MTVIETADGGAIIMLGAKELKALGQSMINSPGLSTKPAKDQTPVEKLATKVVLAMDNQSKGGNLDG